ncbi:YadA-like family protein [Psychrobacter sp. UBA5136]|uniref:YadA-like family protein n=1 Tax=Psychrobacter sp. UBA5136 TaxID=1947356 RepID=UPI0025F564AA|nr:YadA-like family protein [Psychrobacter sp. UBA5136]
MNRNYKVIWNASLNCFMAVSEYAKARGKSSQSSVSSNATINTTSNLASTRIFRITTIWLGLMAAGFSMQAQAIVCFGATSVECGTGAVASNLHGVAIGKNAKATGSQAVAIGGGVSGKNTTASGEQSIAIGANVQSLGASSIAIGGDDLDAASKANIEGAASNKINGGDVNNTFKAYTGHDLVESPPYKINTESAGAASVAIGSKALSRGALSTAIGVHSKSLGTSSSAFGMGASAIEKGSVALGAGSVANRIGGVAGYTAGATGNSLTDINNTKGSAELGVVSVGTGKSNGNRQIVNVAAGSADSDAVNVAQLKGLTNVVATNKTKYYSVNSSGGTNDDNLGATGENAMAMGRNAVASGSQAISIGSGASGQKTTARGAQSIAIGANTVSTGASSIAIGGDDLDAASKVNFEGKKEADAVNGGDVNATFKAYTGRNLVESPPYQIHTESAGAASIAMGAKALSSGALSTAIGVQSASAGVASSAFGVGSSAMIEGSVALGAGSVANVAGGALGYVPTGASIASINAINATQSGARSGAVSVGSGTEGGNRQIVNLAAGTTDSDAVNVAQLKGGVSSVVDLGFGLKAADGKTVMKQLGDQVEVVGANSNITTKVINGKVAVDLNNNLDLGKSGSVKMGTRSPLGLGSVTTIDDSGMRTGSLLANTDVNGLGVFVNGPLGIPSTTLTVDGLNIIGGPSVTRSGGIDAGNKRITRVSNGIDPTDAVNLSQLTGAAAGSRTEVKAGTNIVDVGKTVGDKGQDVYTVNAKGTTATAGSSAVTVNGNEVDSNITDYTVDLSQDSKDSLAKANNSVQYDNPARTSVTLGGDKEAAPVTLTNVASGDISKDSTDAVNGSQLFQTDEKVNQGFGLKAADGKTVMKQLGDQVEVVGANSNITTKVINGKVAVDLNNNLDLGKSGSVKMGNTTVSKDGMTIAAPTLARTVVLNSAGLNNGGNKITNVLAGTDDTDAVNVKQLKLANTTIDRGLNFGGDSGKEVNRKLGDTLTVKGGDTISSDPATKNISVTANGKDTLTVRLAKDINLGNTGSVTTGNTQVNNAGITLYNGDNAQVALTNNGLNNGNNKITNVAEGTTSTDAVNFDQLSLTNTNVSTNAAGIKTNKDTIALGIKIGDGDSANDQRFALGDTINVTGDSNIATTASATGVQVKLSNRLNLGDDGRMQMGNSIMNNTGFTFIGNESGRTVILGAGGLNNGFNRITNVAAGIADTDAATVGQLNATTFALDKGWGISAQGDESTMVKQGGAVDLNSRDGNIKISRTAAGSMAAQAGRAVSPHDMTFDLNRDIAIDSMQTGDTTVKDEGLMIAGGPSVTKAGINAVNTKITNVVNGDVAENSKEAINGGQLYAQGMGISSIIGGNTTYDPATGTFTNNNIGGTGEGSIDGAIASIKRGEAAMTGNIQTNTSNIATNTTNIAKNAADIVTNTTNITNNTTNIKANKDRIDAGLNFGADSGANINKPMGDGSVLSFKGGNNIKTTAEGSSIKFDLNGNINVESVTTGNTTVNNSGVTIKNGPSMTAAGIYAGSAETAPSMTVAGINAAGTKVTNVADGMAPRDAVNFGQLDAVSRGLGSSINELGYRISEVEDDANAGISAAMAMSSLPQAYIVGKSMIGGGVATYNGESAVAIGFSKMSNDGRWVMKLNGTADTQGNVGGAIGAGFHFD